MTSGQKQMQTSSHGHRTPMVCEASSPTLFTAGRRYRPGMLMARITNQHTGPRERVIHSAGRRYRLIRATPQYRLASVTGSRDDGIWRNHG